MSSTTRPSTIRALLHDQKTQSLNLDAVPIPGPSPTQYLIKAHAVALTNGELDWPRPEELTISSPGCEFVATVIESPSSTAKFQPGDKVYGRVQYPQCGAARDYSVSDDNEMALRPKDLPISEAATVPMSALTAFQALFEQLKLVPPSSSLDNSTTSSGTTPQKRILITNGSGGVGIWAVQLAKLAHLHVTATTSTRNVDFVQSLGADTVLDYRTTNIQTWVEEDPLARKVDFVLDCIGGSSFAQAWHAVKPHGQVLTIAPPEDMVWKWDLEAPAGVDESVKGKFFVMHPSGVQLAEITKLLEAGVVKSVVDSVFNLDDFEKAFARMSGGGTRGKVVLWVDEEE